MSLAIELSEVAKRYRNEWILRGVNIRIEPGRRYAITGPNGSGKSTLMRLLSGHLSPSQGKLRFFLEGQTLEPALVYRQLAYAAPYIDLIEELTLQEAVQFHRRFKPLLPDTPAFIELLGFPRARLKQIRHFSSGMKQRLKLALAIASATPLLLLDEPTTNLDRQGVEWYLGLIARFGQGRTIVVASNVEEDYSFCEEMIGVEQFKGKGARSAGS